MSYKNNCPICGGKLRFLAGKPAHELNQYCTVCDYEAWDADIWLKTKYDSGCKMTNIIIYGPRCSGKTTHAALLAETFGKKKIVDDWDGLSNEVDSLLLTDVPNVPGSISLIDALVAVNKRTLGTLVNAISYAEFAFKRERKRGTQC